MMTAPQKCLLLENPDSIEAAEYLRRRWPRPARAGIILGTGLGHLATRLECDVAIPYETIPHFSPTTALSHVGRVVCGTLGGIPVVALEGRWHFYEGYCAEQITLPIFVMRHLGVDVLIVSNASGGLNPRFGSGDVMAVADHINLMGQRTARLSQGSKQPSRSGDSTPYDPDLIDVAQEIARREGFACHRGTYVAVVGPNYETRAEYRAMRRLGGDAVGMSTVPEVLAARRCGMRVLALSTITNIARPDAPTTTTPQEVVEIASMAEPKLGQIVIGTLQRCVTDRV